jgi:hypothetical protein
LALATVLLDADGSPIGSEPPDVVFPAAALTCAQQALRERPDQHGFTVALERHLLDIKRLADGRALVNLVAAADVGVSARAARPSPPPTEQKPPPSSPPPDPLEAPALLLAARTRTETASRAPATTPALLPALKTKAPPPPVPALGWKVPARRGQRPSAAILVALLLPLAVVLFGFGLAWPLVHGGVRLAAPEASLPPTSAPGGPSTSPSPAPTAPPQPAIVPMTTLGPGDRGPAVRALQARLRQLGYFSYRIDTGYYGPITIGAVGAFQLDRRLRETGVAGLDTIAALNHCVASCARAAPSPPAAG